MTTHDMLDVWRMLVMGKERFAFGGRPMAFDFLEDILALLYATSDSDREKPTTPSDSYTCPICGAELEEDGEGSGMRCPDCGEESDC
jgi:hypothetical protein